MSVEIAPHGARVIEPDRWRQIQKRYEKIASDHSKVCKYPNANQWLRLEKESVRQQFSPTIE